jgi:predicted dehydrogenase
LLTVGVIGIGCGYWGPNLIRNFINLKEADVRICSDLDEGRLKHMKLLYPSITTTTDYGEIIRDESIDAVVIATPVSTHYKLAAEALEAGKHVFCEKPLTQSVEEGTKLIGIADDNDRTLMVGHTFVYTAAVNKVRDLIKSGELGDIHYMSPRMTSRS